MNRRKSLEERFWKSLELFNEVLDSGISSENTMLAFFTPSNGLTIYESFCNQNFPKYLRENYKAPGYFHGFAAQAFVEGEKNGVLIRSDFDWPADQWETLFLHEISHLFCARNEIAGGSFFDRYCLGKGLADDAISAGYAIWREAVADIMADTVVNEYAQFNIWEIQDIVIDLYEQLDVDKPQAKRAMSTIIAQIMLCAEVAGTESWEEAKEAITDVFRFPEAPMMDLLKHVFENLHNHPFWTISEEFILILGEQYFSILMQRRFRVFE